MNSIRLSSILDKTGVLGTLLSGFSCAACFPALASIGAAVGLGFLSRWEGLFVHVLIPIFLLIALLANALGWFAHRQWHRAALGSAGPLIALSADFGMTRHFLPVELARILFYAGIVLMVVVSISDMLNPAHKRCAIPAIESESGGC
ncbi:MAG: organomercurial transporter MerC [Steroidobacteraceae bacterium]